MSSTEYISPSFNAMELPSAKGGFAPTVIISSSLAFSRTSNAVISLVVDAGANFSFEFLSANRSPVLASISIIPSPLTSGGFSAASAKVPDIQRISNVEKIDLKKFFINLPPKYSYLYRILFLNNMFYDSN